MYGEWREASDVEVVWSTGSGAVKHAPLVLIVLEIVFVDALVIVEGNDIFVVEVL